MNEKQEQILAALKKLGPSSPSAIADETGIDAGVCGYHLRALLKDRQLKASGTSGDRLYALPDQKLDGAAPPQDRKPAKGNKKKKRSRAKHRTARAVRARATAPADAFIPGLTADGGLVIVGHAPDAAPLLLNPERTSKLADLLFAHYEA